MATPSGVLARLALEIFSNLPARKLQKKIQDCVPPRDVVEEDSGTNKGLDAEELAKEMISFFLSGDIADGLDLFCQDLENLIEGEVWVFRFGEVLLSKHLTK
ncbi:hypothetical protein HG530_004906 [Fusarium avenaceum]|nr:hypothetical protein HG530_004906 [Fusarium avenaceum]